YTGETAVVANVPMLVAVPGAVATSLGDELTTLAEAAFGIPGVTQDGYMAAVDRWRKVQMVAMSPGNYSKANDAGGGDFYYSWKNYLSECVVPGINLHHITQDTLFNTEFFQDAAKYESLALGSYINVGAGWVNLDCKDTYAALMTYTTDTFLPALKTEVLAPVLFDENVDDPAAPRSVTVMTTGMVNALGVGAIDQDKMIISIFTSQIYQPALAARMRLYRKPDVSVMIEDGIRRRNAQWIGQGSVFRETLMNVVVFLEGFFYGMVPFVVIIALLMGVAGLGLISKIFIAMLWVPLWPPILAFIHNYLINSLRGAILKINDVNGSIVSFAGGFAANDEIQKVLASAEMFAAYVPFIALFLLYGSLYSLNSVAGAISATDTVTENQAAPLQRDYAAVEYNAPRMVNDAAHGTRGSGTDAYFPQFTVSDTRGESTELAENRVAGARSSFSNSVRQALSSSQGSGLNTRNGFTFSERATSGSSEVYGFTQSENFSDEMQTALDAGLSQQEASSVIAQTSLGINAGLGRRSIGGQVSAGLRGQSQA
ncbi:MAG: conjugal transfer protein TraG N-terminal domain-containing protein, partial [Pseudomonadota bacterium]